MSTIIPPSELILNADGSVYHLNLLPEELAPTVITVGDPERVPMVSQYLDSIEVRKQKREFVIHTGTLNGKRITVLSTGMGTDNIDIVFNELDALVNIDLDKRQVKDELTALDIIRIGTSGGLQESLGLDSAVISTGAFALEGLMHYYDYSPSAEEAEMTEAFNQQTRLTESGVQPLYFNGSNKLVEQLGSDMHKGITATCGGFYAPQGRQLRLSPAYPDILDRLQQFGHQGQQVLNFEMETAGMYGLGRLLGHHCVSISAVIANRALQTFSSDYKKTVNKLIETVLERLTAD